MFEKKNFKVNGFMMEVDNKKYRSKVLAYNLSLITWNIKFKKL
jgi:hypothetical protein